MSLEYEETETKQKKAYRKLGQGLRILHEHDYPEVDILAVPGLGTHPEECWTWTETVGRSHTASSKAANDRLPKRQFNWIRDKDGLAKLFPRSRIMLYDYASAWRGKFKVRATMKSICTWLLDDLKEKRKGGSEITRPLIFIAHSMGGVVVAKTLCMAKARREFEAIVTCTMGCAFFGVPFKGSDMAKIALLYSSIFGNEAYESLLQFMKAEKNDVLEEVTDDFVEISNKLVPPIELLCVWEQVATDVSYADRALPTLLNSMPFRAGVQNIMRVGLSAFGTSTHFVEMESAVLQGAHSLALQAGHSDLVKFESIDSSKFGPIKTALSKMVQTAKMNVRRRTMLLGQRLLTQKFVNQVRQSLEGVDMRLKLRARVKQRTISSWLVSEPSFQEWSLNASGVEVRHPFLWLRGGPGLGKTDACLAAIQQIGKMNVDEQHRENSPEQNEAFLAYFLCEDTSGCCTAEDVLKGLMTQLISEEESLAQHAKWFVPISRNLGLSTDGARHSGLETSELGSKATATVDNLWKCLLDMLEDPIVSSIHIIISNIHCLETSESTNALLSKLREHAFLLDSISPAARSVKWLISSRGYRHISEYLTNKYVLQVDMENDHEYGAKIKSARRKYAKDAVLKLRTSKKYSPDLAYYVRNSIESQSEDEKWIDVMCSLLGSMPDGSSDLSVMKRLKEIGHYSVHKLVDYAWEAILTRNEDFRLEIGELLEALTIAYEPPSLADLAVLTQIDSVQRLIDLVRRCSPVLQIGDWDEHRDRVIFTSPEFEDHLSVVCHGESDLERASPQKKRYHGLMSLRCFKHITYSYKAAWEDSMEPQSTGGDFNDENQAIEVSNESHEPGVTVRAALNTPTPSCTYPIKYLFRHLSEGFPDVAQELYEDDPDFWGQGSGLSHLWLQDFQALTTDLKELNVEGMSALHVAAGIGANQVITTLLGRNPQALSWVNEDGLTALHVAAHNNHQDIVDTLLRSGAAIEAGEGGIGTALHFAASRGNRLVMSKLIEQKANVNAFSVKCGPVINAAILSGTVAAVQQVMNGDVRFDFDYTTCQPPISLSAGISEPSLFRDILETGKDKWLMNVKLLDQALVQAAYGGRLESLQILLDFQHTYTNNTIEEALLSACQEKNWKCANGLLDYVLEEKSHGRMKVMKLSTPFYLAANSREEKLDILQKIWNFTDYGISKEVLDFSLHQATISKKNSTVQWLLETCGASPNAAADQPYSVEMAAEHTNIATSVDFGNPLNAAANAGNLALVKALVRNGAKINVTRGYSLQLAASEGHAEVVQFLLSEGAVVNKQVDRDEDLGFYAVTALQAACDNHHTSVVKLLLDHGADPNLGGGALSNPITAATQRAEADIFELLLAAPGINVNVEGGEDRSTPLINAATHMATDSVERLLEKGADLNAQNTAGDTALVMAALKGNETCVELLCERGADVTHQSPRHGLPVQAAAKGSNTMCARVLAEKMGGTIESLIEKVKIDKWESEQASEAAKDAFNERNSRVKALELDLEDAKHRLETARKEIEEYKREKEALLEARSFQGSAYEAIDRQIRAVQEECAQLNQQLASEKGQAKIAQATAIDLKKRLEEERAHNETLRSRQGFAAMQEEHKVAVAKFEAERKAAQESFDAEKKAAADSLEETKRSISEPLEAENQSAHQMIYQLKTEKDQMQAQNDVLTKKIEAIEFEFRQRSVELASAHMDSLTTSEELEGEKKKNEKFQEELKQLAENYEQLQKAFDAREEEQAKAAQESKSPQPAQSGYFVRNGSAATMTGSERHGRNGSVGSPALGSNSGPTSPRSNDASPMSPTGGFRTIHGIHRADGAMGGYRNGRGSRKPVKEDSLYESSIKGEAGSSDPRSSRSDDGSGGGSAEVPKVPGGYEDSEYAWVAKPEAQQRKGLLRKFSPRQ